MQFSDLLTLYFDRSNSIQSYWTIYVVVVGGLLAFSSLRKQPDLVTTILLTVLFTMFAYKNLGAIHDVTIQRFAVLDTIRSEQQTESASVFDAELRKRIEPTLNPPEYDGVSNFHIASDILTIILLWAMEVRRRNLKQSNSAARA